MVEEPTNLVDLLEVSCSRYGERDLFGTKQNGNWDWTSYAQFKRLVDDFRAGLAALGIGSGDRVGLISGNHAKGHRALHARVSGLFLESPHRKCRQDSGNEQTAGRED